MAKKALGKTFNDIFNETIKSYDKDFNTNEYQVYEVDIDQIQTNPHQPRKSFDKNSIKELADSILKHGLLQPILVKEELDSYTIIAGERRYRASKLAKIQTIKAVILNISDEKLREYALIENIQREDLSAIDLALSYEELIKNYNITHDELANIVKKSRTDITNTLRLLNLSTYTKNALNSNKISKGHAKSLIGLNENKQKKFVDSIIGQKLNVRELEKSVKKIKNKDLANELNFKDLENFFKEKNIKYKKNFNKINFSFNSNEEIQIFLEKLKK